MRNLGSVEIKSVVAGDITANASLFTTGSAFDLAYKSGLAAEFGINAEQIEISYAAGSVVITVTIYAASTSGTTGLTALTQTAQATFASKTAATNFINTATASATGGTSIVVTQQFAPVVFEPPSGGGGSSGLSGGAIAGIVIGVLAGVLLMLAGVYFLTKSNRSHAPQFDAGQTPLVTNDPSSKKSTGSGFTKSSRKPPTSYPGEKTPFAVAHTDAARGGQPIEFAENI